MASFEVEVLPGALREWSDLTEKAARLEVAEALESLRAEPLPAKSFRLVEETERRLYLEHAIVIYSIDQGARKIWVLEVGPRKR